MLSRKPALTHMQKTYDDCYLVCSTAVYFETQGNEAEALRSWKNALEQINYHNAFRVPMGYRPKTETERALMDSLRQMEEQCKERVELLQTLKQSREDADEQEAGVGMSPGARDRVEGWLGEGTVPPSRYSQLAKPPRLPERPAEQMRRASSDNEQRRTKSLQQMEEPVLPGLTPFASNPKPQVKVSRTPSPEKKERSLLRTLRPSGGGRKDTPPPKSKAPVPAAKAAAQAWSPLPTRPGTSSSSVGPSADYSNGAAAAGRHSMANTSLPRERPRMSEPAKLSYRSEYTPPKGSVNTSDAIAKARRYHGRPRSPEYEKSPERERSSSEINLPRASFDAENSSQDDQKMPLRRKAVPAKPVAEQPILVDDEASQSEDEEVGAPTLISPEERLWQQKVAQVMKNLPKGVDQTAAKQIMNEIVVHGDTVHWADIAGLDVAKTALKETVVYPFLRPDLFMGLREPARGMLLFGPPGTGKTMLARAVATESKSTFFAISASSLTSKFLGESEKLVRALFALAKALAPSIVFVDEIDSLLSARGDSGEHEATRRIKTEFLIQWSDLARAAAGREPASDRDRERGDASRVLVLAATNTPWAIDEAARRRFVRRQYIPLPEGHVRKQQLETLLGAQKHSLGPRDIDRLVLLTDGFSNSDITALAKDAAMGPLRSLGEALLSMTMDEIRPISIADFERSLKSIRPSVSREGLRMYEEWAGMFGERGG